MFILYVNSSTMSSIVLPAVTYMYGMMYVSFYKLGNQGYNIL